MAGQEIRLCQKCQEIPIDDSRPEFSTLIARNDPPKTQHRSAFGGSFAIGQWGVIDTLPHLPALRASAVDGGCVFCGLLRDTIQWKDPSQTKDQLQSLLAGRGECRVKIKLQYVWDSPCHTIRSETGEREVRTLDLSAWVWEEPAVGAVPNKILGVYYFLFSACEGKYFSLKTVYPRYIPKSTQLSKP